MKLILLTLFCFCFVSPSFCQNEIDPDVDVETFVYAQKDTSILKLDKYRLKGSPEKQPCLFFVYGGSFARGSRDSKPQKDYYNYFVHKGFTVVAIDYRLGMKGQKKPGIGNFKPLKNAITMATEDLIDATAFTLQHAGEWNVDPEKFILTGSSAGAITVMHAEYEKCNNTVLGSRLPQSFHYAGVVSYAGAIFSTDGGLEWKTAPCPVFMLHGDKDKTVPYNKIRFFKLGFFGSKNIAKNFRSKGFSYAFTTYKDAAHEVSSFPMKDCREEVLQFIQKYVLQKQKMQVDTEIKVLKAAS